MWKRSVHFLIGRSMRYSVAADVVVAVGLGKLTFTWGKRREEIVEMPYGSCNFRM